MPKLQSFIYCLGAEQNANNETNLINVVPFFGIEFWPSTFSFTTAFTIIELDSEKHILKYEFYDPNNNIIVSKNDAPFDMALLEKNSQGASIVALPEKQKAILGILSFNNVVFREKGVYKSILYLDGEKIGEVPIYAGERTQFHRC